MTTFKILADETKIVGGWSVSMGNLIADSAAVRVYHLISAQLTEIERSDDGWSILYKNPDDGRYWELTYPDSENHGGGAPHLGVLSVDEAHARYKLGMQDTS